MRLKLPLALVIEQAAPVCVTVTFADADFVGSLTEVAFTTPIPALVAVNMPLLSTVPTEPVAVQVTPDVEPVVLAVNCCLPPTLTLAVIGVTVTDTPVGGGGGVAFTVTWAVADLVGSSTEVAVTVPVPAETAVNNPLASIVPTLVDVQVTPFVPPVTVAVKLWVCPTVTVAVVGNMETLTVVAATRLPTRYVASSITAWDEWPTPLNAAVASLPQKGVMGDGPAGCSDRNAVTL